MNSIITVENIMEAYKRTELKPTTGQFFSDDYTHACPLTVLYALKKNEDSPNMTLRYLDHIGEGYREEVVKTLGLPENFDIVFFSDGIDKIQSLTDKDSDEYKLGLSIIEQLEKELGEIKPEFM